MLEGKEGKKKKIAQYCCQIKQSTDFDHPEIATILYGNIT